MVGRSGNQAGIEGAMTLTATETERQKGDRMFYIRILRDRQPINVTRHNSITKTRSQSRNRSRKHVTSFGMVTKKTLPVTIFKTQRDQQNTSDSRHNPKCHSGHTTTHLIYVVFLILRMYVYGVGCMGLNRDHTTSTNEAGK